jgi:uncharacterized protein
MANDGARNPTSGQHRRPTSIKHMTPLPPHQRARQIDVVHNAALTRFECDIDGLLCVIDYEMVASTMHITHTEVPPELEGRGIAAAMVRFAMAHARTHGLKIHPLCSYVRVYMQRHPETHDLQA